MLNIFRRIGREIMCLVYGHRPILLPSIHGKTLISISYDDQETLLAIHMCRMCQRLYWDFGNIPTVRTAKDMEAYDAHKIMCLVGTCVIGPRRN